MVESINEQNKLAPEVIKPPTRLNLFYCETDRLEDLAIRYLDVLQFKKETKVMGGALDRFVEKITDKQSRLEKVYKEHCLAGQSQAVSITCGVAYLLMHAELKPLDLTNQQLVDFCQFCFDINSEYINKFFTSHYINGTNKELLNEFSMVKRGDSVLARIIKEKTDSSPIPEWFKGGKDEWQDFVYQHSNLSQYIGSEKKNYSGEKPLPQKYIDQKACYVLTEGYPDWLSESCPSKEDVEKELFDDVIRLGAINKQIKGIYDQYSQLMEIILDKRSSVDNRVRSRISDIFKESKTCFMDFLLYLSAYENIQHIKQESDVTKLIDSKTVRMELIDHSYLGTGLYDNHRMLDCVTTALWMEKMFSEGVFTQEGLNAPISSQTINGLKLALAENGNKSELQEEFTAFRAINQKGYRTILYNLSPLFLQMESSRKKQAKEELNNLLVSGGCIEDALWIMTHSLVWWVNDPQTSVLSESLDKKLTEIQRFGARWLKENYQWTIQYVENRLARVCSGVDDPKVLAEGIPLEKVEEDLSESFVPAEVITEEIQQLDQIIEETKRGNLFGWQVYISYIKRGQKRPNDFMELEGESLEEITQKLGDYIAENKVPLGIELDSVVNALDWVITVPDEVEQIRWRVEIDGQEYKKLKRANERIFYQIDWENRKISAILHHKTAFNYKF